MKTPIVAVYVRVSTRTQRHDSQEREVLEFCKRKGWRIFSIYREKKPGANAPRTVLDQLMQDARGGKFGILAVYKLDRLGRSLLHLTQIVEEFRGLKIAIVATSQGIDTSAGDSAASLLLNLLGSVAEFERELIKDRTLAGLETARRKGVKLGRPVLDPAKVALVRKMYADRRPGMNRTLGQIAHEAKMSIGSVWKIVNHKTAVHKSPPSKKAKSPEGRP